MKQGNQGQLSSSTKLLKSLVHVITKTSEFGAGLNSRLGMYQPRVPKKLRK